MSPTLQVQLKPGKASRLREGYPWVFRGQIAKYIGALAPGDIVVVVDDAGNFLGKGYVNPHSKITVRLLSRQPDEVIDDAFFKRLLADAKALRTRLAEGSETYRAFFAESDGLPGFIVDRYGAYLVVQFLTKGVDVRRKELLNTLVALYQPEGIFERSDATSREREGLEPSSGVVYGHVPPVIDVAFDGLRFPVGISDGQKTGFFLDQRENRRRFAAYVRRGDRVLDCFCYTGSFALYAAKQGAEVIGVDASKQAVQAATETARLNGLASTCRFEVADAFEWLNQAIKNRERFDVVMLDPPAFAKARGNLQHALRGYEAINRLAMQLLVPGGFLVSCSCSQLVEEAAFLSLIQRAACDARRSAKFLEIRGQAWDHPIAAGFPESRYLKCVIAQIQ